MTLLSALLASLTPACDRYQTYIYCFVREEVILQLNLKRFNLSDIGGSG